MLKGSRAFGRARKLLGMVASAAVVATSLVVVGGTVTAAPAQAVSPPLICDGTVVYANNGAGNVRAYNAQTGARLTDGDFTIPGLGGAANGLAIAHGGATAYAITNSASDGGGNRLAVYDVINETLVRTVASPFAQVLRGAVNPADGRYYFASGGVNATMGVYDPDTQTAYQVGTLMGLTSGNGDFAFSSSGDLLVVANQDIFVLTADLVPTTPSTTAQFHPVKIASISVNGNGVAFGDMGYAFVSTGTPANNPVNSVIEKVNPANGQPASGWSLTETGFAATDMASAPRSPCARPRPRRCRRRGICRSRRPCCRPCPR